MPPTVRFTLDGQSVEAEAGDTIAAALLRAHITTFTRSIKYHRPRGPFCLQGSCGQCLVRVDGVPSLPACKLPVREGMTVVRQNAPLGFIDNDLFRAADFVFSDHMDHHHLMIRSRLLGKVTLEVARKLSGLGELPGRELPAQPAKLRRAQVVVIGAGPAGLSAARAASEAGARVLLLEREQRPGGSALLRLDPALGRDWAADAARLGGVELLTDADCVGLYANDTSVAGNALLAVRHGQSILAVVAERVIVATGGVSQPMPFPGVDRPGVHAARGLLALHAQCGVRVGEKLVVVGDGEELARCTRALREAGYEIVRAVATGTAPVEGAVNGKPRRAMGSPVRALELEGPKPERIRCDAIALAHEPAPLHELASGVGAKAQWNDALNGFPVECDEHGRTAVPWVFVAGRVAGKPPLESGAAAGKGAA